VCGLCVCIGSLSLSLSLSLPLSLSLSVCVCLSVCVWSVCVYLETVGRFGEAALQKRHEACLSVNPKP